MRITKKEIRTVAKELGLEVLSEAAYADGKYVIEQFGDYQNITQIFYGHHSLGSVLEKVEDRLRKGAYCSGASGVPRTMEGIGGGNPKDYEIRFLRRQLESTTSGPLYVIEVTIGPNIMG